MSCGLSHHVLLDEYMDYSMYVYDLDPGTTYQIRVVAKNGDDKESPTEWQEFHTYGVGTCDNFWYHKL